MKNDTMVCLKLFEMEQKIIFKIRNEIILMILLIYTIFWDYHMFIKMLL